MATIRLPSPPGSPRPASERLGSTEGLGFTSTNLDDAELDWLPQPSSPGAAPGQQRQHAERFRMENGRLVQYLDAQRASDTPPLPPEREPELLGCRELVRHPSQPLPPPPPLQQQHQQQQQQQRRRQQQQQERHEQRQQGQQHQASLPHLHRHQRRESLDGATPGGTAAGSAVEGLPLPPLPPKPGPAGAAAAAVAPAGASDLREGQAWLAAPSPHTPALADPPQSPFQMLASLPDSCRPQESCALPSRWASSGSGGAAPALVPASHPAGLQLGSSSLSSSSLGSGALGLPVSRSIERLPQMEEGEAAAEPAAPLPPGMYEVRPAFCRGVFGGSWRLHASRVSAPSLAQANKVLHGSFPAALPRIFFLLYWLFLTPPKLLTRPSACRCGWSRSAARPGR